MKILKEKTKFYDYVFDFLFNWDTIEYCRELKETLGYQAFNFSEKKWRFKNLEAIDMLKQKFTDIEIDKEIERDHVNYKLEKEATAMIVEKSEELKVATSSKLEIKGIKGELYDFQKITVEWLINNKGRGLVSLDLGLGKTLCSLAYIAHEDYKKILVITPASVKYSWESECYKWSRLKPFVIDSKKELTLEDYKNHNVFIINYDILKKFFTFLSSVYFDCIIADESSYCKNPRAQRSKAVKEISKNIKSVILLSGTPLLSKPIELFTTLNILDPKNWNSYYGYAKRYCNMWQAPWGLDVSGSSNIPELREKIKRYIIRKKKEEVLKELPEKRFIDIPIKLDYETQNKYRLLEESFVDYLKNIKNKSEKEIQKSLSAERLTKLNELRQLACEGKVESVKEIIQAIIDTGEKIVIFCSYNNPLKTIKSAFPKESVMIIGSTPLLERKEVIDRFQSDPSVKIFLGGMLSAQTGITLTAARNVLFLNYAYVPANMEQAYSRIDRIGQKSDSIAIYQIVSLGTIDQRMSKILEKKKNIINQILETSSETEKIKSGNIVNDILSSYTKD